MTDPTKLKQAKEIRRPGVHMCLARAADSTRVFFGSSDFKVYSVDTAAEKPEFKEFTGHESYVTAVGLAGSQVISGGYDGRLIWWIAESGEQVRKVEAHGRWIRALAVSPDQKVVVSVADDMLTKVWNAETGEALLTLKNHELITPHHYPSMLYAVAISPCGKFLATGDKVGHVVVCELASGTKLAELETPVMYTWDPTQRRHSIGGIRSLAFSPDSKLLAVGGMGKVNNIDHLEGVTRIEVFDWAKKERTHEFAGTKSKGLIERLVFHSENLWLAGAGGDSKGVLLFYDLAGNKLLHQIDAGAHLHSIDLDVKANKIYGVGFERLVVWEAAG